MNFTYANDIFKKKINQNWMRVGILPYYKDINNNIYILLGIYKVNNELYELCALSGGYKRTKENIYEGALREFNEETENYFIEFKNEIYNDLETSPILYSNGKNGIDRILFMIDIKKYIGNCNINALKNALKLHFENIKYDTELYCVDFIDINLFVNNNYTIKLYKDLMIFLKKNNIYKNNNLKRKIQFISAY